MSLSVAWTLICWRRRRSMPEAPFQLSTAPASGRLRLAVNTGTCGRSLGSAHLLEALRVASGNRFDVTETGCDGACHEAPAVTIVATDRPPRRLTGIDPNDL